MNLFISKKFKNEYFCLKIVAKASSNVFIGKKCH